MNFPFSLPFSEIKLRIRSQENKGINVEQIESIPQTFLQALINH